MASSSSSSVSGSLKALADNPLDFLKKNALEFAPVSVPPEYQSDDGASFRSGEAGLKLVQTQTATVYRLQFVANKDFDTHKDINAFVLGFKQNKGNDDVPFVDIPRKNAPHLEGKFLFTAGLTGCSVIVTRLDDNKFRVFHDRRMDSAVLYHNVEMKVDYNDYRIGGRYLSRTGKAITCLQFKNGAWEMFSQGQLPLPVTEGGKLNWEVYAIERKGPLSAESLEKAFTERRATVIQKRVKSVGGILKVDKNLIDGAKDGVVGGVEFGKAKDAISGWEALRKAITDQIKIDRQKGIKPSDKDTYDRFGDDVKASEDIDETWIWLQVKKNKAKVQH